jgi:hypothetical protein
MRDYIVYTYSHAETEEKVLTKEIRIGVKYVHGVQYIHTHAGIEGGEILARVAD